MSMETSKYDWEDVSICVQKLPQMIEAERETGRLSAALTAAGPALANVLSDRRTQLLPMACNTVSTAIQPYYE